MRALAVPTHAHAGRKGYVHDIPTRVPLACAVTGGAAIKSLVTSRDGKSLLANSADRIIRAFSLDRLLADERQPPRELQDVVNRVQWAHASFSSESEHVRVTGPDPEQRVVVRLTPTPHTRVY